MDVLTRNCPFPSFIANTAQPFAQVLQALYESVVDGKGNEMTAVGKHGDTVELVGNNFPTVVQVTEAWLDLGRTTC